jgi:arsenate reductase
MSTTLFGIKNCDTVKKARTWLENHGIAYAFHDFKLSGVSMAQLERWADALGWETLLNRKGTTFRALPESDRTALTKAKALALIKTQPTLIKRPVIDHDGVLLVGFKPDRYQTIFGR